MQQNIEAPLLDVYLARIPAQLVFTPLAVEERNAEVSAIGAEETRVQKYCVWRLLEHAIAQSVGVDPRTVQFHRDAYGKWGAEGFFFSLSHTARAVAVAVSRFPVGVDIETVSALSHTGVVMRFLTETERAGMPDALGLPRAEHLLSVWCKKEALFKMSDKEQFSPAEIETVGAPVRFAQTEIEGETLFYAVAAEAPFAEMRVFTPKNI